MILTQKKVGETPLEMLNRLREEQPLLKNEKLSYAGRLDPMAEGEMLVLAGEKENKDYKKYLGFDKEYVATFVVGMETDTGDVLGIIKGTIKDILTKSETENREKISVEEIEDQISGLKKIKKQKYPWFSSKTVNGLKLFDHYKKGNTQIERPTRDIEIKKVELLEVEEKTATEIEGYIFSSIKRVRGDFRQDEILKKWQKFFANNREKPLQTFTIKILVSSGTYIRALTEGLDFPTTLLKLRRTKIFV